MTSPVHIALANGATAPKGCDDAFVFDYRQSANCARRINISLPAFVRTLYTLPNRVLDLLELASYVFAVDRCFSRGCIDAVEYHSWSRSINLIIRVRDFEFWNEPTTLHNLTEALRFLTGDHGFSITFQPGHNTAPTSLFDDSRFQLDVGAEGVEIALFSGGVDSLAGAIDLLEASNSKIILASHQASTAASKRSGFSLKHYAIDILIELCIMLSSAISRAKELLMKHSVQGVFCLHPSPMHLRLLTDKTVSISMRTE